MATADDLTLRVREAFAGKNAAEQKMFGGTAFMVAGNMAVSVSRRGLLVRVGEDGKAAALKRPHTRPMVMGGREMAGYVFVDDDGTRKDKDLRTWIDVALAHVATLPAKRKTPAKKPPLPK